MRITAQQMASLNERADERFADSVAAHLRERHPAAVAGLPDDVLGRRVRGAIAKGRLHGLTWESSLTGFVELMFEVGPTFDEHPAFVFPLSFGYEDQNRRIMCVYELVTDAEWRDAQAAYDEGAWSSLAPAAPGELEA